MNITIHEFGCPPTHTTLEEFLPTNYQWAQLQGQQTYVGMADRLNTLESTNINLLNQEAIDEWYDLADITRLLGMRVGEVVRIGDTGCTDIRIECTSPTNGWHIAGYTLVQVTLDGFPCTLGELMQVNEFTESETHALTHLQVGESFSISVHFGYSIVERVA
jgi:hypothetical protein